MNHETIDQLVDGTLSDEKYREALRQMDEDPQWWRVCAVAFLEEQALRRDFSNIQQHNFSKQLDSILVGMQVGHVEQLQAKNKSAGADPVDGRSQRDPVASDKRSMLVNDNLSESENSGQSAIGLPAAGFSKMFTGRAVLGVLAMAATCVLAFGISNTLDLTTNVTAFETPTKPMADTRLAGMKANATVLSYDLDTTIPSDAKVISPAPTSQFVSATPDDLPNSNNNLARRPVADGIMLRDPRLENAITVQEPSSAQVVKYPFSENTTDHVVVPEFNLNGGQELQLTPELQDLVDRGYFTIERTSEIISVEMTDGRIGLVPIQRVELRPTARSY